MECGDVAVCVHVVSFLIALILALMCAARLCRSL